MIINKIDDIEFRLKKHHDFSWLKKYGKAFSVIDETGSGCICIGMQKNNCRYFCKIAGVDTIEAEILPKESIKILKNAVSLYNELQHPNLVKIIDNYTYKNFYCKLYNVNVQKL
jgi:serine/threonine-protein kinase